MIGGSHEPYPRWVLWVNIGLAGVLLIGMAAIMWDQPLIADDWDFYLAIVDWWHSRKLIPHPHAYVHLVQLFLAIFGESYSNARIPGVLSGLLNLVLVPALIYVYFGRTRQTDWVVIASIWLYAFHPLTAQNMMLLDIDNTLLVPMLCVILWLWKRTQDHSPVQRIVALGLAFALALWIKLPTPVLIMGCIGLFHLLRGQVKRLIEVVASTLGGGIVFLATFALYVQLTGFTFEILYRTFGKAQGSAGDLIGVIQRFPQGLGVFVLWLSLPLTVLLMLLIVQTFGRLVQRRLEDQDLFIVLVLVIAVFYMLLLHPAWGYPKYQTPLIPLILILVARLFVPIAQALPRRAQTLFVGIGIGYLAYRLIVIGDPFYELYQVTFETDVGDLGPRFARGIIVTSKLAVPFVLSLVIAFGVSRRLKVRSSLTMITVLGILSMADAVSVTAVQVPADYSTRYRYTYGYQDLRQTIADLEAVRGGYAIAVMDVLYYHDLSGDRVHKYVCPGCSAQKLIDALQSRHVDALVWTTKEENRSPGVVQDPVLKAILDKCYERTMHGVFIIYLHKPGVSCSG